MSTETDKRPTWDEYCIKLAEVASERSTCLRRKVGAVLTTRERRIIAINYNGAPSGLPHCSDLGGCLRKQSNIPSGQRMEICRAVHGEMNAIITSAMYGSSTKQTTLYLTHFPCVICAKILVQAGVEQIVYKDPYGDEVSNAESAKIFKQAGIQLRKI
jgi:dCMP deaminase